MKRFRCGDVIPGCDDEFTGDEASILREVTEHARIHGVGVLSPAMVAAVRAATVDEADAR